MFVWCLPSVPRLCSLPARRLQCILRAGSHVALPSVAGGFEWLIPYQWPRDPVNSEGYRSFRCPAVEKWALESTPTSFFCEVRLLLILAIHLVEECLKNCKFKPLSCQKKKRKRFRDIMLKPPEWCWKILNFSWKNQSGILEKQTVYQTELWDS